MPEAADTSPRRANKEHTVVQEPLAEEPPELHVAFVTPRYGEDVVGGAEDLARRTAEELASRGIEVTALSTCAVDHHTWKDHYPPGVTMLNGVEVVRFPAETRLGEPKVRKAVQVVASGEPAKKKEQELWLSGVVTSPKLFEHLRLDSTYTHVIFLPYLFGTTYYGSRINPERSYIIPCLHDEPYAHQPLILEMLRSVKGLMFNSAGERRLAARLLDEKNPGPVVGMGFVQHGFDAAAFRDRFPVRGDFLLYAGRREEGKNTPLLVDYFRRFSARKPGQLSLVLLGAGDVEVPCDCNSIIFDLGRVDEQVKWDAYGAAYAFCQPSYNESLSIVLLESWLAGRPALVNSGCDVTRKHAELSGGGLCFSDYESFEAMLVMLLDDRDRADRIGLAGREYVLSEYNWDSVVARLLEALGPAGGGEEASEDEAASGEEAP